MDVVNLSLSLSRSLALYLALSLSNHALTHKENLQAPPGHAIEADPSEGFIL